MPNFHHCLKREWPFTFDFYAFLSVIPLLISVVESASLSHQKGLGKFF
jgi:hypothetical protein